MQTQRILAGLRALEWLALQGTGAQASVAVIAAECGIPKRFLENICATLNHNGVLSSGRGRFGGQRIAKPFSMLDHYSLARILNGASLAPRACAEGEHAGLCEGCKAAGACPLQMPYIAGHAAMVSLLSKRAIGDCGGHNR
jgi:DNA-binding IscR family transcriptional regulator